ncbi:MAG: hypothetical protein N2593_03740 [Patescibacteria group bacterium]|nr:hypothetical protein [Patescibacteria group bacterium]
MTSLREILEKMGVLDLSKATNKQLKEAAKILREQQEGRWNDAESWGLKGKTPREQAIIDEETHPSSGEAKS